MKNIFKAITLTLAVALTVCLGIFAAACGPETEDPNLYVVTVVDASGNAIDGTASEFANTWVQVCLPDESCSMFEGTIGADGKCSFTKEDIKLEGDTFIVHVLDLPAGFDATQNSGTVTDSNRKVTIQLKAA